MDSASKTDTADICLVSMESRGTITSAMVLGFGPSVAVAQAVDDAVLAAAKGRFEAVESPVEAAVALIAMLASARTFYSMDCAEWNSVSFSIFNSGAIYELPFLSEERR